MSVSKREDDQIEHGADVVGRSLRRDVEVDRRTIDFRQRLAEPFLSAHEAAFDLVERLQELVEALLVGLTEIATQRARIVQQEIDPAATGRQGPFALGAVAVRGRLEEPFKNAARHRLGGNSMALRIERDRRRAALGADTAVARQHQRRDARLFADVAGNRLVERDRVAQIDANVGPREPNVTAVVADESRLVGCDSPPKMVKSSRCGASGSSDLVRR